VRAALLALVLANVLAFAWWQGLLDPWLAAGRDPDRVTRQVEPAKVRVVPIERLEAARRAAQAGCWEVGPLADDRFERALAWARAQGAKAEAQPAKPVLRLRFAPSATDAERRAGLAELAAQSAGEPRPCDSPGVSTTASATTGSATAGSATAGSATAGSAAAGSAAAGSAAAGPATTGSGPTGSEVRAAPGASASAPAGAVPVPPTPRTAAPSPAAAPAASKASSPEAAGGGAK